MERNYRVYSTHPITKDIYWWTYSNLADAYSKCIQMRCEGWASYVVDMAEWRKMKM